MPDIEDDLVELAKQQAGRDYPTPSFLPRKPIPNIGLERLEGTRYFDPSFYEAEWEHIFTKTWQVAVHEDDLPENGSFFVYDLGRESFLFTRDKEGVVRGFYNVCQHRGNILIQAQEGIIDTFTCPFHGWQWHIDGTLKDVAAPELFRQFDDGIPVDELGLVPVRTEKWGGWYWLNMDDEAMPLKDYLSELGEHLEPYELDNWTLMDVQTFEWKGNWKHAVDAFNESYHFAALHPDMIEFGEGHDIPIELIGIHSRMLNYNSTVSELVDDRETMTELREHMMGRRLSPGAPDFEGAAKDRHLAIIDYKRSIEGDTYLPYDKLNDEQLVHQYHYTFFPNATFTLAPEGGVVFRYRPHASDPNICYYDFMIIAHLPPGTPKRDIDRQVHSHGSPEHYANAFDGTFDPILANVLQQDGSNMETMQRGVQSRGFKGMILSDQEVRLRHFHQVVDKFISGELTARGE